MYYIKTLTYWLSLLVITACTSNQPLDEHTSQSSASTEASLEELSLYKDAIIALNDNNLEQAESLFIQLSDRQPNLAGPWANLALIQIKKDNLKQAQTYTTKALEKNPKMSQALNLSGYLAQKEGKISLAKTFYLQAITNKPDYALAHYNVALLYDVYLQDIEQAIKHYQLYLKHNERKDKKTEDWLEGLKATMSASN